jgi:putative lipoprotein
MTFAHSDIAAARRHGSSAFSLAVLLAALLSTLSQAQAAPTPELVGSNWRPVQIGALTIPEDPRALLRFNEDGKLTGRGGCNRFFGTFKTSGTDINLGPIGSTRMACREPIMQRENAFFAALENTASFKIDAGSLQLFDAAGSELARFVQAD